MHSSRVCPNQFANDRTFSLFAVLYLLFPNPISLLVISSLKKKGSGTPTNAGHQPPHLAMRHAPCRARSSVGVPPRLSPQGVFHPKGSALGQASWDAVCAGVTRLRLSQSREAPPAPVIMPGDMMPKPPGSRLQIHPRAPPPLP